MDRYLFFDARDGKTTAYGYAVGEEHFARRTFTIQSISGPLHPPKVEIICGDDLSSSFVRFGEYEVNITAGKAYHLINDAEPAVALKIAIRHLQHHLALGMSKEPAYGISNLIEAVAKLTGVLDALDDTELRQLSEENSKESTELFYALQKTGKLLHYSDSDVERSARGVIEWCLGGDYRFAYIPHKYVGTIIDNLRKAGMLTLDGERIIPTPLDTTPREHIVNAVKVATEGLQVVPLERKEE